MRPSRSEPVPLVDVARVAGASMPSGAEDIGITGVTLDSRSVRPGDLYAALPGSVTHGATFAEADIDRGPPWARF